MEFAFKTDKGKVRPKNEDNTIIVENHRKDVLMMVMDGMGGHNRGEIASTEAMNHIKDMFLAKKCFFTRFSMRNFLKKAINSANKHLIEYTAKNVQSRGMGTTLSIYLIHRKKVVMAYIGDTRAYVINKSVEQKSIDETYVQYLLDSQQITVEAARNHPSRHVITNAIGCYPTIKVNIVDISKKFEYLMLCSDGLYNMVLERDMLKIIKDNKHNVKKSVEELVELANSLGGNDNISVALCFNGDKYGLNYKTKTHHIYDANFKKADEEEPVKKTFKKATSTKRKVVKK